MSDRNIHEEDSVPGQFEGILESKRERTQIAFQYAQRSWQARICMAQIQRKENHRHHKREANATLNSGVFISAVNSKAQGRLSFSLKSRRTQRVVIRKVPDCIISKMTKGTNKRQIQGTSVGPGSDKRADGSYINHFGIFGQDLVGGTPVALEDGSASAAAVVDELHPIRLQDLIGSGPIKWLR